MLKEHNFFFFNDLTKEYLFLAHLKSDTVHMMLGSSPSLVARGSELLIPRGSTVFGGLHFSHAAEGQNSPESGTVIIWGSTEK